MAIRTFTYSTGFALKAVLRDYGTGVERCWRTDANVFEAYNVANVATYGIAVTAGSPGKYAWTVPAALPASPAGSQYGWDAYRVAGASLAASDFATPAYIDERFAWDGTGFVLALTAGQTQTAVAAARVTLAAAQPDYAPSTSSQAAALLAVAPAYPPDVNADGEVAGQGGGGTTRNVNDTDRRIYDTPG